jgi:DNA replication protein DnaC
LAAGQDPAHAAFFDPILIPRNAKLKLYTLLKLLVIDEIGYVPIDRHTISSQPFSRRYERCPMILISNR